MVDKFYKTLMTKTSKNLNPLRIVKTVPNLLESFKRHNKTLD